MPRTKKFVSKPKLGGNKYVVANKTTGGSERRQAQSDQSGKSSYEKHNLCTSNRKMHGTCVNTELNVGNNKFCDSESDFTQDWNIVVGVNLL